MSADFERRAIRKGVSIIRQPSKSPFWNARFWDNYLKRYVVRSTKESQILPAKQVTEELIAAYYAMPRIATPKDSTEHLFKTFAARLEKINAASGKKYVARDDYQILYREDDGLVPYFGERAIETITGSDIRDFLSDLNNNRDEPLSPSTLKKQLITLRKVFNLAVEKGVIGNYPKMPVVSEDDRPRVSFSEAEYRAILAETRVIAKAGTTKIEGVLLDREFYNLIVFLVHSFVRPTISELFALKHTDIEQLERGLRLTVSNGKTGFRYSTTMPVAQLMYLKQRVKYPAAKPGDYVFFPDIKNRADALAKVRKMLNMVLEETGLKKNSSGESRSLYSFRHYAIQQRLIKSGGKTNLLYLAQASGNSVDVLQRFYLKYLPHTKEVVDNLQYMEPKKTVSP